MPPRPEAGPRLRLVRRPVTPEDHGLLLGLDARPGVADFDAYEGTQARRGDCDAAALRRKLHRIVEQVAERLEYATPIAADLHPGQGLRREYDGLCSAIDPREGNSLVDDRRDGLAREAHRQCLVCIEARRVEKVLDQVVHPPCRAVREVERPEVTRLEADCLRGPTDGVPAPTSR
jgi:hypothetical protein